MHLHDSLTDAQAQAGSFPRGMGPVDGKEPFKDARAVFLGNADAVIPHFHGTEIPCAVCRQRDLPAFRGEFHRIVEKVNHDLFNPVAVSVHRERVRVKRTDNLNLFFLKVCDPADDGLPEQFADIKICHRKRRVLPLKS